ncbi:Uncharacterised protein [Vibrio cholerae]|nr:Uncharacterised protein [Vibrio cholerae]CSD06057.1 Uncharacterised protein [Vibrio cholerae]CSI62988.1 Uncharacterised protein [Vibrio cholerae]
MRDPVTKIWHGFQQRCGVGVLWLCHNFCSFRRFHRLPAIHNRNAIRPLSNGG